MKRLIVIVLLVPVMCFGAYQEFYFESGGSNINGGSNAGAAKYTSTNGNWSTVTHIFTPTDGTNPVSAGVAVGDYASIYNDGVTLAVFVVRVTAVTNAANGAITTSTTNQIGTQPTTSATARSIKVGGAWNSMFNATGFPLIPGAGTLSNLQDGSSNLPRFNFKNDQTYSSTSANSFGGLANVALQGYTTAVGDGGKAIWSNSTVAGTAFTFTGGPAYWKDIIFANTGASSTQTLVSLSSNGQYFERCVFHGARGNGVLTAVGVLFADCEFYDNNKSNTSGLAAVRSTATAGQPILLGCYIHDNTGSNALGVYNTGGNSVIINSIIESNGTHAVQNDGTTGGTTPGLILNTDFYNNGGIAFLPNNSGQSINLIRNCNFLKNTSGGIVTSVTLTLGSAQNNAYGSGTQANGAADTIKSIQESGKVTYASGVTPYSAPTTGNFSLVLPAAFNTGLQTWTETDGTNTGTVGFPDIGAAQHSDVQKSSTFSR